MQDQKEHWEDIYSRKKFEETSWYQSIPETSLNIIESLGLSREAEIIDVGGGNSYLVDHLLDLEYRNISILDISGKALQSVQTRLGDDAKNVNWIESDVTNFSSENTFDVWHDRAAFHFLTTDDQVKKYMRNLTSSMKSGGYVVLATFSENGPDKCSGIQIRKYSAKDMQSLFEKDFEIVRLENIDHTTPSDSTQNFTLGLFRRK